MLTKALIATTALTAILAAVPISAQAANLKGTVGGSFIFTPVPGGGPGAGLVTFSFSKATGDGTATFQNPPGTITVNISNGFKSGDPLMVGFSFPSGVFKGTVGNGGQITSPSGNLLGTATNVQAAHVPEPNSTLGLLALGTLSAGAALKRNNKQKSPEKGTIKTA